MKKIPYLLFPFLKLLWPASITLVTAKSDVIFALPPPFYASLQGGCSATGNSQISFRNLPSLRSKNLNFLFLSPLCLEEEKDSDALYI